MDEVGSSKFSFSFILAILLHLLLLTVFVLTLETDKHKQHTVIPLEALQATVFDAQQIEKQIQDARLLAQVPKHKLTRSEKRRLAREKKIAAWRLAAKRQKQIASLTKLSIGGQPVLADPEKPDLAEAEKQANALAKKALARERWLKKVAARKKAAQAQLKKPALAPPEVKPRQDNRLPQTVPSPF